MRFYDLVGGLEHEFYDFPFSWEFRIPNWRTHIFQRGGLKPPTSDAIWFNIFIHRDHWWFFPHDSPCYPRCIFHMFGWGILFKVECVSTRNKILSNPLVIKHGNGKSIKFIHLVGRFSRSHLHVHLIFQLAMFDDRRVQKTDQRQ